MGDELDLSQETSWFHEERARAAVSAFQRRHVNAQFVRNKEDALSVLLPMVPDGSTVSFGDSLTLDEIGIANSLRKRGGTTVLSPMDRAEDGSLVVNGKECLDMIRQAFFSDVYMTGMNAVTLDGKLVGTDALGNRLAPVIFGPRKVIVVAGANKIVKDVNAAMERIHQIAAPINAKRHALKHHNENYGNLPCAKTGICVDCNSEFRICKATIIIEGTATGLHKDRLNVILIGESLGI